MSVYVVMLSDLYQDHFFGVFSTRAAAERYVQMQDSEEGEQFFITESVVQS